MNTINSMTGQFMTMDGQAFYNAISKESSSDSQQKLAAGAADVSQNLSESIAEAKQNDAELQKLSDLVKGHKVTFSVNKELNRVIVNVVDPSTNEVIREIPSEDLQKFQSRIQQTIGLIFDETF